MGVAARFGRYLWRFFVGDSFQIAALAAVTAAAGLLAGPLGAWDGLLFFACVAAVVLADVRRRASAGRRTW